MTTIHKGRAVGMSSTFAAPYGDAQYVAPAGTAHGRDPNRTRTQAVPQEPEFLATIKARSAIRASLAKGRQMGFQQMNLAAGALGAIPVVLTYSGGQWRASTQWGALVESHFCYVECARRVKLKGFTPMSAA